MKARNLLIGIILIMILALFVSGTHSRNTEAFVEEPLMVEEWMTHSFDTLDEEPLKLEDWMTRPFTLN